MNETRLVNNEIQSFYSSNFYFMGQKAKKYYLNENDIWNKKRYALSQGQKIENKNVDNNIISHSIFRDLVDQKINYLLGNDWSTENEILNEIFNDDFRLNLEFATCDAITCGIGWMFVNPDNTFQYVDTLEVVPVWQDPQHNELIGVIKLWTEYDYEGTQKKEKYFAEYWSDEGVSKYQAENEQGSYILLENKKTPHLSNNENWLKVPFIPIKYNKNETSLLTMVKSLIDMMDKTASDTQDLLSDLTNKLGIISGAVSTDPAEFSTNKRLYRSVILPEGGTYQEVGTDPDITAAKTWIEHLRSQIFIFGRGFDPLQAIGANASGEARRNLYTNLDLDANQLESGIRKALKLCIWFINASPSNKYSVPEDVKIKFTRNMLVSISERIDDALKAQSLEGITTKTAVTLSGLTDDPIKEIEESKKEQEEKQKEMNFDMLGTDPTEQNFDKQAPKT